MNELKADRANVSFRRDPATPFAGTRRAFLAGAMAAGVAALLSRSAFAETGTPAKRRLIDVHNHFAPSAYVEFANRHNKAIKTYHTEFDTPWAVSRDLEDMDRSGTAVAMLSITLPGFGFGTIDESRSVIRKCNESAAQFARDYPGRFGSLAAVPLTDTEGALRELEYSFDTLKADGITLFSNYDNRWLGDAGFAPVYEELNRRKAVVFVHPTAGDCCTHLVPDVNDNIIEFAADTTRTVASLLFSGTTRKYPDIRWIISHGGGALPYLIERFLLGSGSAELVPGIVTQGQYGSPPSKLPDGALPEIRKLHFDTAHTSNPIAVDALRKLVPVSQILFGSDFWYRTADQTARNLEASQVFNSEELRLVTHGNAERLFPRFARAK